MCFLGILEKFFKKQRGGPFEKFCSSSDRFRSGDLLTTLVESDLLCYKYHYYPEAQASGSRHNLEARYIEETQVRARAHFKRDFVLQRKITQYMLKIMLNTNFVIKIF
jgi:hypothetical protein